MGREREAKRDRLSFLRSAHQSIFSLHGPIRPAGEGDWLHHHDEPGQSFEDYVKANPVRPNAERTTLYVQPLGSFEAPHQQAMEAAAELLGLFYGLPVQFLDGLDLAWAPHSARRRHPYEGEQILTRWVLRTLRRRKPANSVAVLALTAADLWPGEGWNFVFGQASLRHGVGVWSLHRLGSPEKRPAQFLRRTLKIAVHETGHMFGIRHCILYSCGMNGANHLDEADGQPLWFCPEDELKVWWAFGSDPAARYDGLTHFAERRGLEREAHFWRASEQAVAAVSGRDIADG